MNSNNTPHPNYTSSFTSSTTSTSSTSTSKAKGLQEWWISKDFNAVRKAYISLAKKAHLEKQSGGLRSATFPPSAAEAAAMKIPNEMLQLLTLMHANPHDSMNSSSPGFGPGSATSFGSPLASPANMTPQYGNHMSQPMPSASPLGGMRSSSSPDGSGSDRPNATPSPLDTGTGTS